MTGRAARIASAVLFASLLPITANAKPALHVASVLDTAGSTGSLIKQITERKSLDERSAVPVRTATTTPRPRTTPWT